MDTAFPSALPPGTERGRYKLLKAVGQGGYGITYAAWDKKLDRRVAIKECVLEGLCYRDKGSGRLVPISDAAAGYYQNAMLDMHREVRTLAALNHERIVPVYDVFLSDGGLYYSMPWLDGGTFADRMPAAPPAGKPAPDAATVCRWLQQLLAGLAYLHGKGIIHRDIKPSNILFNERDEPVIIDFGAALNRPACTTSASRGEFSVAYGAPEQITGKGYIGPWTDFFSLAAVFYELISGVRAESADKRLMDDSLLDLHGFPQAKGFPEPVVAAIMRNLSLSPAQRCQSGTEWQRLLNPSSLLHGAGSSRSTLLAVAGGAILLAGVVAGVVLLPSPGHEETSPKQTAQEEKLLPMDEVEKRVRHYFHVGEWEQECLAFNAEREAFFQEMEADYRAVADEINAQERLAVNRDFKAMRREEEMTQKWKDRVESFYARFDKIAQMLPMEDDMVRKYPAKSNAELALVPPVCRRIHQHCVELGIKANPKNYRLPVLQYMVDTETARMMKSFNER